MTHAASALTHLDVGSARLAYRRTGAGPDVVLVHGWPLHGETFRAIVPRLASQFTCHVLDLPGTGRSEWSESTPITLRAHAAAVVRAIELLELPRVGFVAHDSGGAVARRAAAELGARCFGLVLGNTEIPGYRPPALVALVRLAKLPGGWRLLPLLLRSRWLRHSGLGFGGCFHDRRMIDGEFASLFIEPLLASPRVAAGQLALARQFDWSVIDDMAATHARITAPVSLLWGVDDPWFPLARARGMVDQFPGGAELVELPDGKLFVHEERPAEWAEHARRFLERTALRKAA
jgi:pimeloyl-ACP methyl ester carboxylesterase